MTPIDLEDLNTWPDDLRALLDRHSPPHHPIAPEITAAARDVHVLAWHLTRLLPQEIAFVRSEGLMPLDRDFAGKRVRQAIKCGALPEHIGRRLISDLWVPDDQAKHRLGLVHLCWSRSALKDEAGAWRPFTFWGGEAMYWNHIERRDPSPEEKEVEDVLRAMGTACIVEVALPGVLVADDLAECLAERRPVSSPAIGQTVNVRRVIERNDPDFEAMTGCGSWREPLT